MAEYAERSSALIDGSPQMDEQNTKRKIIEPLIDLLGWEILSSDVELEYSVQMGSGTKKVDYGLKLESAPVVFVEAKGCDTTITESHKNQLKSYMRQVGVDWGLLSNGREFEVFRRDHSSTRPNEISLAKFPLQEIEANKHALKALSKESINTGESQQIAQKIESVKKATDRLQENKENIAEEITGVVTEVIGESVSQRVEDEAKSFVDELVSVLDDQAHRINAESTPSVAESTNQSKTDTKGTSCMDSSDEKDDYIIQLSQNDTVIYEHSGQVQSEVIAEVVDFLIQQKDLLEEIKLPYVAGTGRGTQALVNTEPVHTDGSEMRTYKELSDGAYLHTTLSANSKMRYIPQLAEEIGLKCEFSGDW